MAEPPDMPLTVDELIRFVLGLHPEGDELIHLSDAMLVAERLGDLGDHLIGHFVDQARHSGASWSAIGRSMGVTKQAAQKRFVAGPGDAPFSRFTPRARRAIAIAQEEARALQSPQVGSEHLVLGLLSEPEGLAAKAVAALGAAPGQLRSRITSAAVPAATPVPDRVPFGARSKKVLEVALREALRLGHNYIGTEHLLLGVLADADSAGAKALIEAGVTREGATDWLVAALAEITASRGDQ